MNYTSITLGELLSSDNETIKRHAVGILKQLQRERTEQDRQDKEYQKMVHRKEKVWGQCKF